MVACCSRVRLPQLKDQGVQWKNNKPGENFATVAVEDVPLFYIYRLRIWVADELALDKSGFVLMQGWESAVRVQSCTCDGFELLSLGCRFQFDNITSRKADREHGILTASSRASLIL